AADDRLLAREVVPQLRPRATSWPGPHPRRGRAPRDAAPPSPHASVDPWLWAGGDANRSPPPATRSVLPSRHRARAPPRRSGPRSATAPVLRARSGHRRRRRLGRDRPKFRILLEGLALTDRHWS